MVVEPHLTRYVSHDVTLLGDTSRPGGVTLAFTERTGGVSQEPYASLNLGDLVGDGEEAVAENRARLMRAMGLSDLAGRLVNPKQVHGTEIVRVTDGDDASVAQAQRLAREGADAVVCTATDVPVLLLSADCALVVLVAQGGFAVAHSGWRGTMGRIAAKALEALCEQAGCTPDDVACYVGPHIGVEDYEVSPDLAARFVSEFDVDVAPDGAHMDLGLAIRKSLVEAGMRGGAIVDDCPSTATCTERFYSYRTEGGTCGRHGALCVLRSDEGRCSE